MSLPADPWTTHYAGDTCIVLEFGSTIDRLLVDSVVALNMRVTAAIRAGKLTGLIESVPTFRSLALIYDPLVIHPHELLEQIRSLDDENIATNFSSTRHFQIPVHYGEDSGPDLQSVASLTGLEAGEVVALHANTEFTVYMLGFLPGFAFLGDTPAELYLPRRSEPRVRVPAGSVAIAMQLTGIYPWDSPGGWHILGKCPIPLFDSSLQPPVLFQAGDTVRFRAVDRAEFEALTSSTEQGNFDRSTLEQAKPGSP